MYQLLKVNVDTQEEVNKTISLFAEGVGSGLTSSLISSHGMMTDQKNMELYAWLHPAGTYLS